MAHNKVTFSIARAIPTGPFLALLSSCPDPSYLLFQILKALVCITRRWKTPKDVRRTRKTPENHRHQVTATGRLTGARHFSPLI